VAAALASSSTPTASPPVMVLPQVREFAVWPLSLVATSQPVTGVE
jgi:hypothetical protein